MAALDFPTATVAGQTFEADTGVIYVYVGTPPNGFWSANATVSGQAALDARYVQVAGDSMTGALNIAGNVGIGTTSPTTKVEVVDTLQATANNDYSLAIRGDDSGTDGESAQIFLGAINATTRGTVIAAERQSISNNHDLIFKTSAASAAPTERLRIDSSGNVGIGTASPSYQLDIQAAGNSRIQVKNSSVIGETQFHHDGNGDLYIKNTVSGRNIAFSNAGSERIRIDSSGRLLIGTTTEGGSNADNLTIADSGNCGLTIRSATTGSGNIYFSDATSGVAEYAGAVAYDHNDNRMMLYTASTERMRIDSSGRVGIGTSSADNKLSVGISAADEGIELKATYNGSRVARFGLVNPGVDNTPYIGSLLGSNFGFVTNSVRRMTITTDGKVGIGTTNPLRSLHISTPGAAGSGLRLENPDSTGRTTNDVIGNIDFYSGDSDRIATSSQVGAFIRAAYGEQYARNTYLSFGTNSTGSTAQERMRIDSSGRLGIGTSSPGCLLELSKAGVNGAQIDLTTSDSTTASSRIRGVGSDGFSDGEIRFADNGINFQTGAGGAAQRVRIDAAGNVGVGTTSPFSDAQLTLDNGGSGDVAIALSRSAAGQNDAAIVNSGGEIVFKNGFSSTVSGLGEAVRIDTSRRLLVGTSSSFTMNREATLQVVGGTGSSSSGAFIAATRFGIVSGGGELILGASYGSNGNHGLVPNGHGVGQIRFTGSDGANGRDTASIASFVDGTSGVNDMPGRLVFSTTADGASSPTERMRIKSNGLVTIPDTGGYSSVVGHSFYPAGDTYHTTDGTNVLTVNRLTNDGNVIEIRAQNVVEGSVSVSGGTVSYNGAHLSRWSQLPGNAIRVAIYRGTVLSNIDEMCEWGDENNEQLNRMKISDVEGDRNVSGVFQGWDEDDEEYTDDFYCAMTGDFIIRIGKDVTVERGDLLMSAGDGTAKPQEDDIIRSKTIAKVTSTYVSETYADGSYCVPCVLMAC